MISYLAHWIPAYLAQIIFFIIMLLNVRLKIEQIWRERLRIIMIITQDCNVDASNGIFIRIRKICGNTFLENI